MGSALAVSRADRTRLPNCSMRFSLSGGTGREREIKRKREEVKQEKGGGMYMYFCESEQKFARLVQSC